MEKITNLRPLRADERKKLIASSNTAADWDNVRVADGFDAGKVSGCNFDGYVEIGAFNILDNLRHENVTLKVGLYGSNFRDTVIGDNVAIHNLIYCSGVKIGSSVMMLNVGEVSASGEARIGAGIDVINENGGRAICAAPEMTGIGAYIWAKFRDDAELMAKFAEICKDGQCSPAHVIADNAVIINTKAIRDTAIYPHAIIDGAELIANTKILSSADAKTYIGAAVQIRKSLIGYSNYIDSAAQLDSVMTGEMVKLSKSVRVAHSYIGDCADIACCEVAHCYIAPFHAQHHNNSFLIAAYIGGQSNIAAGATVGSNHNSRTADGEIWAGRGFWPGLCVSLKHNSRFASFTMIAKGDYPAELDVKMPFSLVTLDGQNGAVIYPAFWFMYNMYAAMRCAQKFVKRDKRVRRGQFIEHDILAPDTVEEMFAALCLIERWGTNQPNTEKGRPETKLKHADKACEMYRMMIRHYCAKNILPYMRENGIRSCSDLLSALGPLPDSGEKWLNCGGMVISESALAGIVGAVKAGVSTKEIKGWDDANTLFGEWVSGYKTAKIRHAVQSLARLEDRELSEDIFVSFLQAVPKDCETIAALTRSSRAKDFSDPFRTMVYTSNAEMNAVLGQSEDAVIRQTDEDMENLKKISLNY